MMMYVEVIEALEREISMLKNTCNEAEHLLLEQQQLYNYKGTCVDNMTLR